MSQENLQILQSGNLVNARRLDLNCGLTEVPREVFEHADTLEVLNLTGNALRSLPEDLPRLHKLRILFCSSNNFTTLPEVIGDCSSLRMVGFKSNQIEHVPDIAFPEELRWLILTDNHIETLPESLGQCSQMQKLMLSGNRLRYLPESFAKFDKLELLRIAANQFEQLPPWLPTLPRLAWLAFAGNPVAPAPSSDDIPMRDIPWSELQLGKLLGEGASGRISRAQWRPQNGGLPQSVAVKVFKGTMTSDGLPENEMAAAMAAGTHGSFVEVLGRVAQHPDGAHGLVMSLLDEGFMNLAGPPSFESCTRDVYNPDETFSPFTVHRIALSAASACAHLHARGLMLGDLYAHNILHHPDGRCRITDFGGATFVPRGEPGLKHALERLEVRAFGNLLEELLERCETDTIVSRATDRMRTLQAQCQGTPAERPLFEDILAALERIVP